MTKVFKVIKQYGQLRKKKRTITASKKMENPDPTETDLKIDTARSQEPELRTPIRFASNRQNKFFQQRDRSQKITNDSYNSEPKAVPPVRPQYKSSQMGSHLKSPEATIKEISNPSTPVVPMKVKGKDEKKSENDDYKLRLNKVK